MNKSVLIAIAMLIVGIIIGVMYGYRYLEYEARHGYEVKMMELKIRKTQLEIDILKINNRS